MNQREFIGNCFCDYRYRKLVELINTCSIEQFHELYNIHKKLVRNTKYHDLEKVFETRRLVNS